VDIESIMKGGATATNYQILPGDRVFIAQDSWVAFDSIVGKVTAPFERMFGFAILGASTVRTYTVPFGTFFCWTAREAYGVEDPRWMVFQAWMLTEAPSWLQVAYAAHGRDLAAWLHDKPLAKAAVRAAMEMAIAGYELPE
jgi:hypothetical protein